MTYRLIFMLVVTILATPTSIFAGLPFAAASKIPPVENVDMTTCTCTWYKGISYTCDVDLDMTKWGLDVCTGQFLQSLQRLKAEATYSITPKGFCRLKFNWISAESVESAMMCLRPPAARAFRCQEIINVCHVAFPD